MQSETVFRLLLSGRLEKTVSSKFNSKHGGGKSLSTSLTSDIHISTCLGLIEACFSSKDSNQTFSTAFLAKSLKKIRKTQSRMKNAIAFEFFLHYVLIFNIIFHILQHFI